MNKLFRHGSWRIYQFYDCLELRKSEPESMWDLHRSIYAAWAAAKPGSITARVAHGRFLTGFAWHARGTGFSDTVTEEGWRLFAERLKEARKVLDDAKALPAKCPVWWRAMMIVALGQSWSQAEFGRLFTEAKTLYPDFWGYDTVAAYFLLPRWHGEPGDWERMAESEIDRKGGLGLETYARVVTGQMGYYDRIFKETKASWPKTRDGYEIIRGKYPDSLELLSAYTKLACIAGDRPVARKLFLELGGRVDQSTWKNKAQFIHFRKSMSSDEPME